jgi:antitoxin VapB
VETAELFKIGRNQAVRLPEDCRFEGDRIYIKRVGSTVILIPYHAPWQSLFDSLEQFSDDFMAERERPER